jgi:transposase
MDVAVGVVEESLARRWEALRPHLNERQRRLWLGSEARELGSGGAVRVASVLGVAADTVRRGRAELDEPNPVPPDRSRQAGGGRKRAEHHQPDLPQALERLVDPATRGDPESPLRWTTKSTRELAKALQDKGYRLSDLVVRRLLKEAGYSLQANAKTAEGRQHPDRDGQFRYLNDAVRDHQGEGEPVISVDAKRKELIGAYKNAGQEWQPTGQPEQVNVYDFIDREAGKVTPYGVYDVTSNTGWVGVGTDHDTAAFAVATIGHWWDQVGRAAYPDATRLLITADGGGSNGHRTRQWKTELAALAARTGLTITVTHLPPGTSKWNKIEHRLFSVISINWRGRPLTSHEVILETIGATTTTTGLTVRLAG